MSNPGLIFAAWEAVDRLHNSLRRRLLTALPVPRRLGRHACGLEACIPQVGVDVHASGSAILVRRALHELLLPAEAAVLDALCDEAQEAGSAGNEWSSLDLDALLLCMPEVYRLGLSPALLDIAEAYLDDECLYLGPLLKCEKVDGVLDGNRCWHLDVEDDRMLRVLIYLNAVGPGGGPFEYVDARPSSAVRARSRYRSGYVSDARFERMTGGLRPAAFYGGPGDAILFDGARLFHRAQPPTASNRYSVTFSYVSRKPLELRRRARLSRANQMDLRLSLTARQAASLPKGRLL